jgi:hypothetical protein
MIRRASAFATYLEVTRLRRPILLAAPRKYQAPIFEADRLEVVAASLECVKCMAIRAWR